MSEEFDQNLNYLLDNEKVLRENYIDIDEETIKNIIDTYRKKEYVISVVGCMKSGKSTFINALIGDDLMPSENAACTLTTTHIRNSVTNQNMILKKFENKPNIKILGSDLSLEFHNDIKETRKNNSNEKFCYITDHKIECLKNLESYGEVILVDTPGLNEMAGLGVSKEYISSIFDNQIKKSNLIIYVFDYKYYKAQENIDTLERILKLRNDFTYNNKIVFIINKVDLLSYKDGSLEEVIGEIGKILNNLSIEKYDIFCISSKKALISRIMNIESNLKKYEGEINSLRPIIKKECNGEIIDIQMPIKDLKKNLLIDSNIQRFENEILAKRYINIKEELNNSVNDFEKNLKEKILGDLIKKINEHEANIRLYEDKKSSYDNKINLIRGRVNAIGEIVSKINETLSVPNYEVSKRKEMLSSFYINSDFVYPYCDYDEYYKSESKAKEAGMVKFKKWKNSIKLQFDDIYQYYNFKLTGGNFLQTFNNKITSELKQISEVIEITLNDIGRKSSYKIIPKLSVMLEPIMNLNYDNSTYYIKDMYDNSAFISFDYSERYVKGIFGERLKEVVMYDISNAIKNEEEDYEKAFINSSEDFFKDYYKKKYKIFIPKVKAVIDTEIKKSENIFKSILSEYYTEYEAFKSENYKNYKVSKENLINLKNILEEIGE